jgi:hypothetical protein
MRALDRGVLAFLEKPVVPRDLLQNVAGALDQRQA